MSGVSKEPVEDFLDEDREIPSQKFVCVSFLADGEVDDDEREVLKEIISHLGLAEESLPRLLNWTVEGYAWMQSGYDILNDLSE